MGVVTVLLMDGAKDFKMLIVAVAVAVLVAVADEVPPLVSTIVIVNAVLPEVVLYVAVSLLETDSVLTFGMLDVEMGPRVAVVLEL